jgi:hypothetical protein
MTLLPKVPPPLAAACKNEAVLRIELDAGVVTGVEITRSSTLNSDSFSDSLKLKMFFFLIFDVVRLIKTSMFMLL